MTSITSDTEDIKHRFRDITARQVVAIVALMTATLYLATDYSHPHNWQPQARLVAYSLVFAIVAWAILREHKSCRSTFDSRYLLGSGALAMTVLTIRILYPLTGTPDTFNSRINRILNVWLAWPFAVLSMLGLVTLFVSIRARSSLAVYVAMILCGSIVLSMNGDAQAFLRMVVYKLPFGPRL